jgi:hypothetical protein
MALWGKRPVWIGLCEFCKFTQIFDLVSIVSWESLFGSFALSLNAWIMGEEYAPRLVVHEGTTPQCVQDAQGTRTKMVVDMQERPYCIPAPC